MNYVSPALVTNSGVLDTARLKSLLDGTQTAKDLDKLGMKEAGMELLSYLVYSFKQEGKNMQKAIMEHITGVGVTADISLRPQQVINELLKEKKAGSVNFDKGDDTDVWALQNNYVSVVPVQFDLTNYELKKTLEKNWDIR